MKKITKIIFLCFLSFYLFACSTSNIEVNENDTQIVENTVTTTISSITQSESTSSSSSSQNLMELNSVSSLQYESETVINNLNTLQIHFVNTGNSDCIIIQYNDKVAVLDGGDNNDEQMLVQYLKKIEVKEIDFIQMTHTDADHCGGLDAIVENFIIDKAFVGNGNAETKTYKDFIETMANKELYPTVPIDEFKLYWDDNTYFQFFNTKTISKDPNENSIITLFVHGTNTFLFTGDAGQEQEKKYMDKLPQIDVLKVGHHGSKTSTNPEFIKHINPDYAVILCGTDNKYGHPHKETLDTLKDSIVYRTDLNGNILILSDKNKVTIQIDKTREEEKEGEVEKVVTTTKPITTKNITTTQISSSSLSSSSINSSGDDFIVTPNGKEISSTYKFKNCDEVRQFFPSGFNQADYPELYDINTKRDRDKDGFCCEN